MKNRVSFLKGTLGAMPATLVLSLIFLAAVTPVWAMSRGGQDGRVASSFVGSVTRIDAPLQFTLDCCKGVLLKSGIVDAKDTKPRTAAAIESVLRAHKWSCTGFGRTAPDGTTQLVWCNAEDGTLMGQMLFDQGLVTENCAVSGNQLGTCRR